MGEVEFPSDLSYSRALVLLPHPVASGTGQVVSVGWQYRKEAQWWSSFPWLECSSVEWVRGSPEGGKLRALCKGSFGGQKRPHCEAGAERRNRPRKRTIYTVKMASELGLPLEHAFRRLQC